MKRARMVVAFILVFALISAVSLTAYAIGMQVKINHHPFFREAPDESSTIWGQFNPLDIFDAVSGSYDSSNRLWYGGYADPTSNPYPVCGNRLGYSIADSFELYSIGP